jgi:PEP-CTERM motif-containing protein
MRKLCIVAVVMTVVALGSAARADAAVIGLFSWDDAVCDVAFSPCFTVLNFSDVDFLHVSVAITDSSGDSQTLIPGSLVPADITISAGESLATLNDLSNISISLATLSLATVEPGIVRFLVDGTVVNGLTAANTSALIDFVPDQGPPVHSTPEPATFVLMMTGAAAFGGARLRRKS